MIENLKQKVQIIVFKKQTKSIEYLCLKQNEKKGSLWQPITGSIEKEDKTIKDGAIREIEEEIGITKFKRMIENIYEFVYSENNKNINEQVFAIEIEENQKIDITKNPSDEHVDFIWSSYDGVFELYEYFSQKEALTKLHKILLTEMK